MVEARVLRHFKISLHARPAGTARRRPIQLAGTDYQAFQLTAEQQMSRMTVSFEEVVEAFGQLPRMLVEPDGSFVWTGSQDATSWQLDGCVYDSAGKVVYVDVAGTCPWHQFQLLLAALGRPASGLLIQLSRQAVFLDEHDFRRYVEQTQ